jgi:glycosyltransferase involved in cell wall biosynthesis
MITCYQVNLFDGWGGSEIYTVSFTRALLAAGVPTTVFVRPRSYLHRLLPEGCTVIPAHNYDEVLSHLPEASWVLFQMAIYEAQAASFRRHGHFLTSVAHMTLFGRSPAALKHLDWIAGDSQYVLDSLAAAGITQFHPQPLWGIADLETREGGSDQAIVASCPYGWDPRKMRDRLFGWLYPYYERFLPQRPYVRKPGITLGIVSRLANIKQFPLLLSCIAPVLARHPHVNLEIFGNGGYATVRDMRRASKSIHSRVRFWGYQRSVGAVYRQIDYLMAGIPDSEAFGLNLVEAEICGTPVLAINAPPFTETVLNGVTGFLYEDPRKDNGISFERLIDQLSREPFKLDSAAATAYLERFSEAAYHERVARFVESALHAKSTFCRTH